MSDELKAYIAKQFLAILGPATVECEVDPDGKKARVWVFGAEFIGWPEEAGWRFVSEEGCSSLFMPHIDDQQPVVIAAAEWTSFR